MGRIFRLTDDPPNELRGFSYAYVSNSGENKEYVVASWSPHFRRLALSRMPYRSACPSFC